VCVCVCVCVTHILDQQLAVSQDYIQAVYC